MDSSNFYSVVEEEWYHSIILGQKTIECKSNVNWYPTPQPNQTLSIKFVNKENFNESVRKNITDIKVYENLEQLLGHVGVENVYPGIYDINQGILECKKTISTDEYGVIAIYFE